MKALKLVALADLSAAWSRLRPALDSMDKGDGWIPEDIYMAIRTNSATLYTVSIDDEEQGFLVLRALGDYDGLRLHIWVLHSHSKVDLMTEFSDELDGIAKSINAGRITFSSTRSGWAKVAPKHGFRVRETVYERKIKS